MRTLILLVIAAAVGAIGASSLISTLQQRDAVARGTMNVLQHHLVALRGQVQAQTCNPAQTAFQKTALAVVSADVESAIYPTTSPDLPFMEFDRRLRSAIESLPAGAATCAEIRPAIEAISAACDACHQQYR